MVCCKTTINVQHLPLSTRESPNDEDDNESEISYNEEHAFMVHRSPDTIYTSHIYLDWYRQAMSCSQWTIPVLLKNDSFTNYDYLKI